MLSVTFIPASIVISETLTSRITIMAIIITVSLILAAATFLITGRKWNRSAGLIIAGAIGFYVPQMLIRIPLLQLFEGSLSRLGKVPYILILGISAALFETIGRFAAIRFTSARSRSIAGGICTGLGHGYCELFSLLVMAYINNIALLVFPIKGMEDAAVQVADIIGKTSVVFFLVAFWERLCVIVIHVLFSVLIVKGLTVKRPMAFALLVFALHAVLDTSAVMLNTEAGILYAEIFITLCAAVCGIALRFIIKKGAGSMKLTMPEDEAASAVKEGY